ncbi:hypothetical protein MMC17_008039 [Xylographa soralifera]|nr:hypothetical protein [Xylographa soralifera]
MFEAAAAVTAATNGPVCPQEAVIIPNGGFDSGSLVPWNVDRVDPTNSSVTLVSPGNDSPYAVQLSAAYGAALTQNSIPLCQATNYSISFDYKVTEASSICTLYVTAKRTNRHKSTVSVPMVLGDWTTASLTYSDYTSQLFTILTLLDCNFDTTHATVLVDNFTITPIGSIEPPGCPLAVDVENGDFETGLLAPWTPANVSENPPSYSIVSPGYNSEYALQLAVPTTTQTVLYFLGQADGLCLAYEYTFSFALNWEDYDYPDTGFDSITEMSYGCALYVRPYACTKEQDPIYPPNVTSGWQEYSFTCLAGDITQPLIQVLLDCETEYDEPAIPAFDLQLDGFSVELAT